MWRNACGGGFVLYEILGKTDHNIFVNLTESQWREARKLIIKVILGTDMSHHFEQISKSQVIFYSYKLLYYYNRFSLI